ncbi:MULTISPECIES: DUF945 domain-containing protein [Hyphomonas]|nr:MULTISPECIES: DUF945 domain-containing protein [Hyphomonas]
MRKFLILFIILAIAVIGTMWWLGQRAVKNAPPEGEIRIPVEGALE